MVCPVLVSKAKRHSSLELEEGYTRGYGQMRDTSVSKDTYYMTKRLTNSSISELYVM